MAFDRAKVALQVLEERLRKMLGLAGTIDATFTPSLTPVIVVGDTREPGYSTFRGRHWVYASNNITSTNSVANQCFGVQWMVDVLIDGLFLTGMPPLGRCGAYHWPPDDILSRPVTTFGPRGTWIDQKRTEAGDFAPIFDTNGTQNNAGTAFDNIERLCWWTANANGIASASHVSLGGIHLPAQSRIYWDTSGIPLATTHGVQVGAWGRIF